MTPVEKPVTEEPADEVTVSASYNADYFAHHCGDAYDYDNPHWPRFFGEIADRIVQDIAPGTSLDAGCAMGFLVAALNDRGVDAHGVDISSYAISKVRKDVANKCWQGDVLEPFPQRYDLITCIEVLEHLPAEACPRAVANLCAHSDDIIFTSTPFDYDEETHINVRPPEYWAELFARQGFFRDVDYDATYLTSWAVRYRRSRDPLPRIVANYERSLWHLRNEAFQRNQTVLRQMERLNELERFDAEEFARAKQEISDQQSHLVDLERKLREQSEMFEDAMEVRRSLTWRVGWRAERLFRKALPTGTRRGNALHLMAQSARVSWRQGGRAVVKDAVDRRRRRRGLLTISNDDDYSIWLRRHTPDADGLAKMRRESAKWTHRPKVSIVMPVFNAKTGWLDDAVTSVLSQVYTNWELCIADDASTDPHVATLLREYAAGDHRIKVKFRETNGGISAASNSALDLADGEYIALLDHDDVLQPHALYHVVEPMQTDHTIDVVYSDEDKLLYSGDRGEPLFKPAFSPELLLGVNYMCHLSVIRRSLVDEVGGFREGFEGSQDHDLMLRVTERTTRIAKVDEILYTWRQVHGSTSVAVQAKPESVDRAKRAVEEALVRRGRPGRVTDAPQYGYHTVRYDVSGQPSVSIVIPTRDRVDLLRQCVDNIEAISTYRNYTITIVDNGSSDPATLEWLAETKHRVVKAPGPFNYSRIMNLGVAATDGEYVLTMNNDAMVKTPDWIEAMLGHAQHPEVGAVGVRLLFPSGGTQHEGIAVGAHPDGVPAIAANLQHPWQLSREVSAVTGACMLIKRSIWDQLGGLDEMLHISFNDVDFCLRVRAAGYINIYTPSAELYHPESSSRGPLNPGIDADRFRKKWGDEEGLFDPYLNPHTLWLSPLRFRD
jgi:GT2 family glycosyltransferase